MLILVWPEAIIDRYRVDHFYYNANGFQYKLSEHHSTRDLLGRQDPEYADYLPCRGLRIQNKKEGCF